VTIGVSPTYITGMGAVSALGVGVRKLWQGLRSGQSGVTPIVIPRTERQQIGQAAHLGSFNPEEHIAPDLAAATDRFVHFAIVAADEAVKQAGWRTVEPMGDRTAVIIGSGIGGSTTSDVGHYKFYVTHERGDPMTVPKVMPSAAASHIAMRYGARGPSFAVSSACSSSSQAIGLGLMLIRSGVVDRAIVGGSEAMLTPATFRAWETLRVMTPGLCRPFSRGRDGMVLGEGAAVFLLENEISAKRGTTPLAELSGYGTSSDAYDIVRPDPQGAARSMQLALADASLNPSDIDYINAHGTGTILNDVNESESMRLVFDGSLPDILVSSTKPIHGHALGAAGAIELVATICALRDGLAPPTINWQEPDPRCIPDPVANFAREKQMEFAMSNSFAFGGINASLIVKRFEP
jgi:nodulation protein E